MDTRHLPILRRAGTVLLAAGLIDLAALAYSLAQGQAYVSGFNLFAVVAGVFMLRGSLQAALVARWFAVWMLAALLATVFVLPFMQPFSLTFAQLRLGIGPAPASIGLAVLVTALLGWLAWQPWSLTPPALVGVALVVGLGVVVAVLRGGEAAAHARELAAQQVTPDYRLHVRSVSKTRSGQGTRITATVTAWTDSDIKTVPVQWQQP